MPLVLILMACAAILYGLECLCGMPGLTLQGMVIALVILGCFIGIFNWCILVHNLRSKKYTSFIPLLATLCFMGSYALGCETPGGLILLALVIDPWSWTIILGLPWLLLRRVMKRPES